MDNLDTQPMFGDAVSTTDTPRLAKTCENSGSWGAVGH